jgi:putative restriction endonuclease
MNPLQRALIEKTGNDNGFEHVLNSDPEAVALASARHPARAVVTTAVAGFSIDFFSASPVLVPELLRSFPQSATGQNRFSASGEAGLAQLLRRAANLSRVLPSQAANDYQQAVAAELAELPAGIAGTEVERMVRLRIGQNKFREALLEYWGGECAVTSVAIPEVLRASHAKPWAECATDAERLDVFNGFLLSANLDALFDRFLISFDVQGTLVIAPALAGHDLQPLGIAPGMKLRWVNALHQPYLAQHRARLIQSQSEHGL